MTFEKGKTYRIKSGSYQDSEYLIDGLWIKEMGRSWADIIKEIPHVSNI